MKLNQWGFLIPFFNSFDELNEHAYEASTSNTTLERLHCNFFYQNWKVRNASKNGRIICFASVITTTILYIAIHPY